MHENVFYLNSLIIYLLQVDRNEIKKGGEALK